ncbi:N-6 DNA methylase [Candidatus Methylomirabilis sp.]|uniref:N-6 DNA methylase n=1 Tax=Candidatus Methylomirabilis sp. TaxID=2032687 RepID=UPI003C7232EB
MSSNPPDNLTTEQVLDCIFKDPAVKHGLSEFDDLGKHPHQILKTFPKTLESGRAKGEVRYYLKCLKRGEDIQVFSEKKSNPEEIVRQLWLFKLHHVYHYPLDHIAVEYQVDFGTITAEKAADIVVFQRDGRTAKIVVEVKRPDRKEGINQLKSYLNAEGSPVGVWSNGQERVILYRPYPREFEDTLTEIPTFEQEPKDVLAARLTVAHLKGEFDFKRIIQNLEELVLANAGVDEFNEIFKIIFAKIYDEKAARDRKNQELAFRKSDNPQVTYETINALFRKAMVEWPGIFDDNEQIKLTPQHLQVVVGPVERIALLGANMRVMDDAFEYLMPSVAKKKNGQFFTPRYVIDMCVKMLNPKKREHVVDPACGSGGFLLHTMEWVRSTQYRANAGEHFIHDYAAKYLWGIDFDERSAKVSRALMLIAGDGRSHVYKLNSLDPREWVQIEEGMDAILGLKAVNLIRSKKPTPGVIREPEAWEHLADFSFDVLLTNPPFAGEIRDQGILSRYELARKGRSYGKPEAKVERDVLFIERCLRLLKPGGRMAIVLPQGKFNNSTLAYIREWILRHARVLAVAGLHPNTFKPHTGTKTSTLFLQKHTDAELARMQNIEDNIQSRCPNYSEILKRLIATSPECADLAEEELPEEVAELLHELFDTPEEESEVEANADQAKAGSVASEPDVETLQAEADEWGKTVTNLRLALEQATHAKDREKQKKLKAQIREAEKRLSKATEALKRRTIKGRVELLLGDAKALEGLRRKWIDAEIAKKLDYPIFMATSEQGGKDSSGTYIYCKDPAGNTLKDARGNPLIEQDCVKYRDEDPDGIAEQFVKWAKSQKLAFWGED